MSTTQDTDSKGRASAAWHEAKAILDSVLAEKRSPTPEERARIDALDAELDRLQPDKAVAASSVDALARVVGIFAAADGRSLLKSQQRDLDALRPAIRAQLEHDADAYTLSLIERAEQATDAEAPAAYQELSRVRSTRALVRAADARTGAQPVNRTEPGRVGPSTDAPLATRLFDLSGSTDAEVRSLLTSTSSSALATRQDWREFSEYLAPLSAALSSGVRVVDIDATAAKFPVGTAPATGAWLAEGATAVASEMGVSSTTITPTRLTVFSEVSNEVLEDASFPILEEVASSMFASLGAMLDKAVYEGTGASNQPQGMYNLAGSGTAVASGTAVDFSHFIDSLEGAYAANSEIGAWATNAAGWAEYANLKIGGTVSYDMRPLLTKEVGDGGAAIAGRVLGVPMYTTSNIATLGAGTAAVFGYNPQDVWVVRRRDFQLIKDPYTKAEQGITRFVLEGRFGVHFPYPAGVRVFSIVTP